jgi:hypothetical protein
MTSVVPRCARRAYSRAAGVRNAAHFNRGQRTSRGVSHAWYAAGLGEVSLSSRSVVFDRMQTPPATG